MLLLGADALWPRVTKKICIYISQHFYKFWKPLTGILVKHASDRVSCGSYKTLDWAGTLRAAGMLPYYYGLESRRYLATVGTMTG